MGVSLDMTWRRVTLISQRLSPDTECPRTACNGRGLAHL